MLIQKQNIYFNNLYEYPRDIPSNYLEAFEMWRNDKVNKLDLNEKLNIPQKNMITQMFNMAKDVHYIVHQMKLITMDIILNKSFSFKCIETGKIYRSKKSFHVTFQNEHVTIEEGLDDMIIYIFDEISNPFFVCIGGGGRGSALSNEIYLLYYYQKNLVYSFNEQILTSDSSKINLCERILNYYNTNTIINNEKICTTYGYLANIGHTYWNEVSSFKFLLDLDLLKYVDLFIIGPYDYYNLYDYLKKNSYNVTREKNITCINNILSNNSLIFKYNDMFMYEDLKQFILENNKLEDENEIAQIESVKKNFYPIITFNIRGVYRNLHNQENCITTIINNLLLLYPNMFVIFDGFIKNTEVDLKDYSTEGVNANENIFENSYNNISNTIIQNINTKNYISLIGTTLNRELRWLEISNYGLMQLGAGAFNYTWLMNKKALFIGRNNKVNDELLIHTFHDFYFRENKDFTTYLNPDIVKFDINEKKEFFIPWKIIFINVLRDIIILEKNNYNLSQIDNFKKYNIYMHFGLDNLSVSQFLKMKFYDCANTLKHYINTSM